MPPSTPPAPGLLAVNGRRRPGLGRIRACLSCWPQFFHAVINPADNAALRALFLRTHSTLPHILMAWHGPLPQSPLCLRHSTLPGPDLQLLHILVKHSASQTTATVDWCARAPRLSKVFRNIFDYSYSNPYISIYLQVPVDILLTSMLSIPERGSSQLWLFFPCLLFFP